MTTGRPTDYRPEFGEQIIDKMRQGYSLTAAAASIGVHRQRVYEWEKRYASFADDIKLARALRLLKLEEDLLEAKSAPAVTSRIFALKNADRDEWGERQEVDINAGDGLTKLLAQIAASGKRIGS